MKYLRLALLLSLVALLCLPPVFTTVVNALAHTANWCSYKIGWDWHQISDLYNPASDILNHPEPNPPFVVWVVLALVVLDLIALSIGLWKFRKAHWFQLLVGLNICFGCFMLAAFWVRVHPLWW
jgi:VanZ family protein